MCGSLPWGDLVRSQGGRVSQTTELWVFVCVQSVYMNICVCTCASYVNMPGHVCALGYRVATLPNTQVGLGGTTVSCLLIKTMEMEAQEAEPLAREASVNKGPGEGSRLLLLPLFSKGRDGC